MNQSIDVKISCGKWQQRWLFRVSYWGLSWGQDWKLPNTCSYEVAGRKEFRCVVMKT